jgi:hypothetical protein
MLDTAKPIELTHDAVLMSKDGRHWKAGKYKANTVPPELAQDIYGKNFEASDSQEYSETPVLGEDKEPELKLETKPETKIEDKPPARAAQPAAAIPAPPVA